MADPLRDAAPGQPLGPVLADHERINLWNEAARQALRAPRVGPGGPGDTRLGPQLVVYCRNDTGADLADFSIVTLQGNLLVDSADADRLAQSARDAREAPLLSAVAPAADKAFAVLQEPIPKDAIGRATVLGVTPVWLRVNAAVDVFAKVIAGDSAKLDSTSSGPAQILWKQANTGTAWAWVLIGQGAGGGMLVGKLDGALAAGGSAVMSVWAFNGAADADTGENVTVYDWFGAAVASGKKVFAAFVGGRWRVIDVECP